MRGGPSGAEARLHFPHFTRPSKGRSSTVLYAAPALFLGILRGPQRVCVRSSGVSTGRALISDFPRRWKRRAIIRRPAGAEVFGISFHGPVRTLVLRRSLKGAPFDGVGAGL